MTLATPIRRAFVLLIAVLACGASVPASRGQTGPVQRYPNPLPKPSAAIPATAPTIASAQNLTPAAAAPAPQHIDVEFVDGKISVNASNASLNQVLREVASKAGIKVTGSVNDERVFGQYGPSTPSVVLASLLDGTGANMLLVDDPKGASELILTQRRGSPTPPNPSSAQEAGNEESEPASRYIPPIRPFQPPAPGRGPLAQAPSPPQSQPDANQGNDPGTARQIFDQLQRNAQQNPTQAQQQPQQ